jgi:hypothetical protein
MGGAVGDELHAPREDRPAPATFVARASFVVAGLAAAFGVGPALAQDSDPGPGWRELLNRSQLTLEAAPERPQWPQYGPPPSQIGLRLDLKLQSANPLAPMGLARGTLLRTQLSDSSTLSLRVRGRRIGLILRAEF